MRPFFRFFFLTVFCLFFAAGALSGQTAAESASSAKKFEQEFKAAQALFDEGKLLDAQAKAKALISKTPSEEKRLALFRFLRDVRFKLLLTRKKTDTSEIYEVQATDTMGRIAKKYNTTIELIKRANNRKKDVVWTGMKLKVEKVPFSIEIHIKKNVLWLKQGEHFVKKYRVSTGEKGNTPVGEFKIANKVVNPAWYYEDQVIPPGDSKNGLGTRWMGFDLKGYGIHGTIEPEKIGQAASLGCVRLRNEDVEELFDLVPVGTPVKITKGEPQ